MKKVALILCSFGFFALACDTKTKTVDSCGDGFVDPGEACDGTDLDDQTCETLGFHRGNLACQSDCTGFDTSGCTNCGNGAVDDGEQYDGANLDGQTCQSQGWYGGTLACAADEPGGLEAGQ